MKITTSASGEKGARQIIVDYPIGESLDEAKKLHTEEVVYNMYVGRAKVAVQNMVRVMLKAGKSDKEIHEAVKNYKLSEKPVRAKSAYDKAVSLYTKLSPEERKKLVEALKAGQL